MKRIISSFIILIPFALSFLTAQTTNDLSDFLNPDISLEVLSRLKPSELDEIINSEKFIVINGTVSSIMEIERSDNDLILDLHVVNGKWIGLDKVENYSCIVNINGKEWESRFPGRTPRVVTDDIFVQNDRILVIGKLSSYVMEQGVLKAVIDADYLRKIQ